MKINSNKTNNNKKQQQKDKKLQAGQVYLFSTFHTLKVIYIKK